MALRAEGNQVMLFGNGCYSNANNSVTLGRYNINKQQASFVCGEGLDTSNGSAGVATVGRYSDVVATTAFAVGVGTSEVARKNCFEVTKTGEIILPSPNGTKYAISVADDGTLSVAAI